MSLFLLPYRVLQLMNLTDSQLSQRGSEKLELAILSFFEQFRKMYVGDQAQKTSKVRKNINLSPQVWNLLRVDSLFALLD